MRDQKIAYKNEFSLETEDALSIKAKENAGIESDKDVTLKGKNIKMTGSKGVYAEGKQIAVQDDQVMGFDTHIMVVPAGTSTKVKINGKEAAVIGSHLTTCNDCKRQFSCTTQVQKN